MNVNEDEQRVTGSHYLKKVIRALVAGALLMTTTADILAAGIDPTVADVAYGNDNPTLAFGLIDANYWSPGMQYIDLTNNSYWIAVIDGRWGALKDQGLVDAGYISEAGEVIEVPSGDKIGMHWTTVDGREGIYVLSYKGEGAITIKGGKVLSQEDGKIVFELEAGKNLQFWVTETDPNGTGAFLKDISIVREEHQELFELGATFNPDWLALIEDARQIRFMDWMETNGSDVVTWDDYQGQSIEHMVALANETGADPWFNMPHMADDDFIRKFATYVRDNLDPELTVRVEYSNETWNYAFEQTKWLLEQAKQNWGDDGNVYYKAANYSVKMAVNAATIWEDVFSGDDAGRLVNVLGGRSRPFHSEMILNAEIWKEMEPESYVDPATVFEEYAVTTYFGGSAIYNAEMRAELIQKISDPTVDATQWLYEQFMDETVKGSIPYAANLLRAASEIVDSNGLKLVAYEGGQHVHHSFAVKGLTQADIAALTDFLSDFVRSDQMGLLYQELWEVWQSVSDSPFMQYGDIARPSKSGSWGLYSTLEDSTARSELLEELNTTTDPWWDAVGGMHYQNGVTLIGSDEGEMHVGSAQEDYLVGKGGDDIFVLGMGDDGAHGGDGFDVVVMRGALADYTITREGNVVHVEGPEGSDTLVDVEEIRFSSGEVLDLTTMVVDVDGAPVVEEGALDPLEETPAVEDPVEVIEETATPAPVVFESDETVAKTTSVSEEGVVSLSSTSGLMIGGINKSSALGKELGLASGGHDYVVTEKGKTVDFGGQMIEASYYSIQEGITQKDGVLLGTSALEIALKFGTVVTGATAAMVGSAYDDTYGGREANDHFDGADGDDYIAGNGGDDLLIGGNGNDKLFGGVGDDTLYGGAGNDLIDGGDGIDTFRLSGTAADYRISNVDGATYTLTGLENTDTVTGIEWIVFDDGTKVGIDTLLMQEEASLSFTDLLASGAAFDASAAEGVGSNAGITVGAINRFTSLGKELHLTSSDKGYIVTEKGATATFDGLTVGANYWTTQEAQNGNGGTVLGDSAVAVAEKFGSVLTGTDMVSGSAGDDSFFGRDLNDIFAGGSGNDYMNGAGGNDIFFGGAGNDLIKGGAGHDIAIFSGTADDYWIVKGSSYLSVDGRDGTDKLYDVETLLFEDGRAYDVASGSWSTYDVSANLLSMQEDFGASLFV